MSNTEKKILGMLDRVRTPPNNIDMNPGTPKRPMLPIGANSTARPNILGLIPKKNDNAETERKLKDIMKISGALCIDGKKYNTDIKDMEFIEELGNGTCGHVVKMRHNQSNHIIAVKQMRRSGNTEENKRIIMDIEVVLKSHGCKYIVQCLGCFINEAEVWICMELMDTCFDKLLKRFKKPVPEEVLGKVTVAIVEALSYLKDKHGVIHRDVKPSNILLDSKGNVKLCDFGISGRLVDSLAKTRSAGCAAYMAPERIDPPDPNSPDYDVRADVWSLGITLVELATAVFPYKDCKTDFEVLAKVIEEDPPYLPYDREFSSEFRDFVKRCLIKNKDHRPKYVELKYHPFMKKYETANVNVGEWYITTNRQVDNMGKKPAPRSSNPTTNPIRQFFNTQRHVPQTNILNGGTNCTNLASSNKVAPIASPPSKENITSPPSEGRVSRLSAFQSSNPARNELSRESSNTVPSTMHQRPLEYPFHQISQPNTRSYSPFQAYQNHIAATQNKDVTPESHIPLRQHTFANPFTSPLPQRRVLDSPFNSPYVQRRGVSESRWKSPNASPLLQRSQIQAEEEPYNHGNTSPIILQRYLHQQKQQQLAKEAEETAKNMPGKKRIASFIKLQLGGGSGRSSRHQSPEPPPRLNRQLSGDNQSPLALRRNFLEANTPNSPSLSRRYVSPTPPVPPPRRLSESTSVPGSPQHLRTRFAYTPEPQRRLYQNNDIS